MASPFLAHLRLDEAELPSCDRTPPRTPKTPLTPGSPFELHNNTFCFRQGPKKSVIYQPEGHPKQAVIDGEIWPPIFKPRNVRSAKMLKVNDSDLFIATYPKCGTTLLQHICHQLIRGEHYQAPEGNELCVQSPMIERMGGQYVQSLEHPRILKTHFNHMNVPKSQKAKYIYCVRNPKDCLTSYYHHNRNFKIYNFAEGDFDTFFDLFLSGQLAFGDYFDHLQTWLPHINDDNVLFLKYEDLVANMEETIVKIGQFIGGSAVELVKNPARLATVVRNSSIDAMKQDQKRWFPNKQLYKAEFIRKGGSRDWKNHMSREQSDKIDALFRTRMAGTIAENWWLEEMSWDEVCPIHHLLAQLEIEDDFESVSRRGSFSYSAEGPKVRGYGRVGSAEEIRFQDPHLLLSQKSDRRCSFASLLSTGYGSVWSINLSDKENQ